MLGLRFCTRAFSSCGKWGPLFIAVHGPLTIAASCCGAQAPDAQAQQLWLTGPVTPRHVGSSQTRARTRVPCIGRRILNHCATREAPSYSILRTVSTVRPPRARSPEIPIGDARPAYSIPNPSNPAHFSSWTPASQVSSLCNREEPFVFYYNLITKGMLPRSLNYT